MAGDRPESIRLIFRFAGTVASCSDPSCRQTGKAFSCKLFGVPQRCNERTWKPLSMVPVRLSRSERKPVILPRSRDQFSLNSTREMSKRISSGSKMPIGEWRNPAHAAFKLRRQVVRIAAESSGLRKSCTGRPDLRLPILLICSAQLSKDVTRVAIRQIDE